MTLVSTLTVSHVDAQTTHSFGASPLPVAPASGNSPAFSQRAIHQTNYPNNWPQEMVSFDSQVRPAGLDQTAENSTGTKSAESIESMIDAAGPALACFKDTVVNNASGLLGMVTGKSKNGSSPNIPKMLSSLAIVLGGYFAFVWVMRKLSPSSNSRLPAEVVEVLGRTSFGPKQSLQLVRLGSKLVLLLNGPDGTHPIGEITEPHEVSHLTSLCGNGKTTPLPRSFNTSTTFHRLGNTPPNSNAPLMNSEQVTQSLTSVLRSLESASRASTRNSFEA